MNFRLHDVPSFNLGIIWARDENDDDDNDDYYDYVNDDKVEAVAGDDEGKK